MPEVLRELPDYDLVRRTAISASAQVYEARAPGGIPKCVKVVPLDRVGPLTEQQRSGLELLLAARHPYIVGLDRIDVGPERVVAVFEWPNGTLREEFRAARAAGLPGIPRRRLVGWLAEAAEGLDYLHAHWRVVHGALRPENLYVFSGHVKLGEFGPLRELEKGAHGQRAAEVDPYLGPEPETAPPSARDQYSLAAVFCELLGGTLPFRASSPGELRRLQRDTDPDLRAVPLADWPALERALSPDPQRRFPACRDFIVALLAGDEGDGEENADTDSLPGATILDAGWRSMAAGRETGAAASASSLEDPEFASMMEAFRAEQELAAGPTHWKSPRAPEQLAAAVGMLALRRHWTASPGADYGSFEIAPLQGGNWKLLGEVAPRDPGSMVGLRWAGEVEGRPALAAIVRELGLEPADAALQRSTPRRPWTGHLAVSSRQGPLRALRIAGLGIDVSERGIAFWTPMPFVGKEVRVQREGDAAAWRARVVRLTPAPHGRPGYLVALELLEGAFE